MSTVVGTGAAQAADVLLLKSNFETESVVPSSNTIVDYLTVKLPSGSYAQKPIQYEAGTSSDRFARVSADPALAGNHAMQFWLRNAAIPGAREGYYKGRVQLHLSPAKEKAVFQRVRMYLHPDLRWYRAYPNANNWFGVSTLWMGTAYDAYPFKLSLNIAKDKGSNMPLYFQVSGDKRVGGVPGKGEWKTVWSRANKGVPIPVGEWVDLEIGYQQGNATTGKFYLAMKRKSDAAMKTILSVTNWTYNPESPQPVSMTHWHPMKLYAPQAVIDYVRQNGGTTQVYWDNLELWARR